MQMARTEFMNPRWFRMEEPDQHLRLRRFQRHTGRLSLRLGSQVRLKVVVNISSGGLLSIGALVTGILLSSAVIVRVAVDRPSRLK